MLQRSSSAIAEPVVGSRTEPDFELTDEQWNLIAEFFDDPEPSPLGGRPRASSRACFEAIVWILRSGARWRDLPSHFPSYPTCWRRLKEWSESGIFKKAWARLLAMLDRQGEIDREESMADAMFSSAKKGDFVSARPSVAREPRSCCSSMAMGLPAVT